MPAKNSIKQYVENGYYHIYNRGVNKGKIFFDDQDYGVFLGYLKEYLMPKDTDGLYKLLDNPNTDYKQKDKILKALNLNNFHGQISLMCFTLKSNHFHLLIKQSEGQAIDKFMNSLCTRFTMYINKKYKRTGTLFQGVYKAVLVSTDEQLLYLSKYIHKQSRHKYRGKLIEQPSSYPEYLNVRQTKWINSKEVLSYFSKINSHKDYRKFVEEIETEYEVTSIFNLMLEN